MAKKGANVVQHPAVEARRWDAAKVSLTTSGWQTSSVPIDVDIRNDLRSLRARSREQAQNNDHIRSFLRDLKANVIGPKGIQLQSRALLRSGRPDQGARVGIEKAWREWGRARSCDVTGRLSWCDVQRLIVETMARDGEALLRLVPGWDNDSRFAVQLIDTEMLDVQYSETLPGGNTVTMGVELDEWRRAVAYHISPDAPNRRSYPAYRNSPRIRVPADQILHLYLPEWCDQTRGVPWTATSLQRLNHLAGYEDAAVVAARAGASKMGFYKRDVDAPGLVDEGGDNGPGGIADGKTSRGDLYQNFDPGGMGILPPGWDFTGWDPAFPNTDHGPFVKAMLRGISSGLGVSYHTLAQDLEGVNYSSLRHASLVERAVWQLLQDYVSEHLCQPVFENWLSVALTLGTIRRPTGRPIDASRETELRQAEWQPRGWSWVDPQKEMDGVERELKLRLNSISGLMRERGRDPDQVWAELAEDRNRLADLDMEPADIFGAPEPEPAPPMPTDDEAENEGEESDDDDV